jgi:hypothetical protein
MLSFNHPAVRKALILSFSCACLSLTACSKTGSWVTGAKLSTTTQNGVQFVELSTQLSTGGIGLIPITLPVLNPHNPSQVLGEITIKSGLTGGSSELDIDVNLSAVLSLPDGTTSGLLPNGTSIPISGVNAANWISLPVANSSSRLYLNLDLQNKKVVVGTAINIDQLSIGVPANLLLPFSSNNINGVAGIYTGIAKGQSGFALFIDGSALLTQQAVSVSFRQTSSTGIQQKLFELDRKRTVLRAR